MMLQKLKEMNPSMKIYSVYDKEFKNYGCIINNYNTAEIIFKCEKIEMPKFGSVYQASVSELEQTSIYDDIKNEVFGEMDIQIGICQGYNDTLNALEYHKCSELNIAVTDMVLFLGLEQEIENGKYDSANVKAFYVPKGEMIEMYATTLHYCPCQVSQKGFSSVVILTKGTNTILTNKPKDKLITNKNKWLFCHRDCKELIELNVVIGIEGENYRIIGE